jgi:nucleoside-diphosphate-sugar epimerase
MGKRKILIIGATGRTGRLVLDRALEEGDTVTVLARRPEALEPAFHGRLRPLSERSRRPARHRDFGRRDLGHAHARRDELRDRGDRSAITSK